MPKVEDLLKSFADYKWNAELRVSILWHLSDQSQLTPQFKISYIECKNNLALTKFTEYLKTQTKSQFAGRYLKGQNPLDDKQL